MCTENKVKIEYIGPNGIQEEKYINTSTYLALKQVAKNVHDKFNSWTKLKNCEETDSIDVYVEMPENIKG